MQSAHRESPAGQASISRCEQHSDGIVVDWFDGHSSFFHSIWLRDCCYCADCGDSYSSKRFVVPADIPLDVSVANAEITPQGLLSITWQQDGHVSHYDPLWLRQHCYDEASRSARFHQPVLWDAKLVESLPSVDFERAHGDEKQRLEMYRKLRDFGFVVVTGGPTEAGGIEAVANLIGDLGDSAYSKIFDLSPSSSIKTMGNTQKAVPPHTDEAFRYAPPGINILGCVRPAVDGGESVLVDGFFVAERLRKQNQAMFELLCHYQQNFNRIHPGTLDQRSRQRMIERDDRGEVIGIRFHTRAAGPMDLPADMVQPYYAAHRELCKLMISDKNQVNFQLQAGDSVLFDNHRVLHSRTEFQDPERFLQICNVARESFHERLRLLADRLGFPAEAGMVLAAGVS
ncbi:MAG: TauD/TfdA family dioxygenase [Gammaproteobacteria bacterium]|nr:TauD/TfdA family dioxygenase [Gammaproteobacteria bacterium]